MLRIKGIEKTSLVDYPPNVVTTIFLGNCNFRCGYCHNPDLIKKFATSPDIPGGKIIDFLVEKKEWLDGVCITGGEPTLYKELPEFIQKVKREGFKVKLDTNGTNPKMLQDLIERKLVDYIAMDIKTSLDDYDKVTGVKVNIEDIRKSIALLKEEKVDYCFRSTVLPLFHDKKTIKKMGQSIKGAKLFVFQEFRNTADVLDPSFKEEQGFTPEEREELKEIMREYAKKVE